MAKGYFISFEGGEGVGKSTQIRLLAKALKRRGYQVHLTQEPGGTPLGNRLRKLVKTEEMHPLCELLIFEASRAEHIEAVIRPLLKKGFVILSDRFADSSIIYQGILRGLGFQLVKKANAFATRGLEPDLKILLDSGGRGYERLVSRKSAKNDRFDSQKANFHRKVEAGFRRLAKQDRRFVRYSALDSIESLHRQVLQDVLKRLPHKKNHRKKNA